MKFTNNYKFSSEVSVGVGVGLRSVHYPHLQTNPATTVEWFEAISENYMNSEGRPIIMLEFIRNQFPVALHGVSMSIAAVEEVSPVYLLKLKNLIERIEPFVVSDHLCWGKNEGSYLHDLLPMPYNEESLQTVLINLDKVQNFLGRKMVMENVSSYLAFKSSTMTEWEFIREMALKSGCGILLDVNNVYVSAMNHGFDPYKYIDHMPVEAIKQIHLAGHTDMGTYLFDTHSRHVTEDVWELFRYTIAKMPEVPVLIEWDEDIPEFSILEAEAEKARKIKKAVQRTL